MSLAPVSPAPPGEPLAAPAGRGRPRARVTRLPEAATGRAVVVGLGPGVTGRGALVWAADEVARTASQLLVLDCVGPRGSRAELRGRGGRLVAFLDDLPAVPLRLRCVLGQPADALLAATDRCGVLVLGRDEDVLGLDEVLVVQGSRRPVAVVPDGWRPGRWPGAVVVALGETGGALDRCQRRALATALVVAARRAVPVTVLADWRSFASGPDRRAVLSRFRQRAELLRDAVAPVVEAYPTVTVEVDVPVADAGAGVLRHASLAGLVVLPRPARSAPGGPGAVAFWDCLDRSRAPVLVVP